jgi:fluoride ion exporter CrcB/FEX
MGQVKFQYMQSYLMYDGLRAGFCSTFTTFGNLIEDTGRLILSGPLVRPLSFFSLPFFFPCVPHV